MILRTCVPWVLESLFGEQDLHVDSVAGPCLLRRCRLFQLVIVLPGHQGNQETQLLHQRSLFPAEIGGPCGDNNAGRQRAG